MKPKKEIFKSLFIDSDLYENICTKFDIDRNEVTQYYNYFIEHNISEIVEIRRIRQLYNNKKGMDSFEFVDFNEFYNWYIFQYEDQKGKCYYCKIEEYKVAELFSTGHFTSARSLYRGKHLEIERKNNNDNVYSKDNCVLACYFCNNDKSDVFSENDYFEYLKCRKSFFDMKFDSIKKYKK
jgi:hypothetical protein